MATDDLDAEARAFLISMRDEAIAELGSGAPPQPIATDLLVALTDLYRAGQRDPEQLKRYAISQAQIGLRRQSK
jgi:hypothetical protein